MYLNSLKPAVGAKEAPKRLGRGIGSGLGKTCGRGHKGQHARAGGFHKLGFEGGQMPIQRRLPKFGFYSRKSKISAEVRLYELDKLDVKIIDLKALQDANVVSRDIKFIKIIANGIISKPHHIVGLGVTAGARAAILAVGGKVE